MHYFWSYCVHKEMHPQSWGLKVIALVKEFTIDSLPRELANGNSLRKLADKKYIHLFSSVSLCY